MAGQEDDRTGMRPAPEPTSGSTGGARAERWAELLAAVVLSLATVLTAWSAFEATKWGGVMAIRFSEANAARTQSAQASATANAKRTVDVTVFAEYLSAVATDECELVAFLQERFRDEFKPAFQAWVRQRPRTNPAAPPTPFAMAEYRVAEDAETARLAELADVRAREAREATTSRGTTTSCWLCCSPRCCSSLASAPSSPAGASSLGWGSSRRSCWCRGPSSWPPSRSRSDQPEHSCSTPQKRP
jgi:hypothetical protein